MGLTGSSVIIPIAKQYPWWWVSVPVGIIYLGVLCWLFRCYLVSFSIDSDKLRDWAKSAESKQAKQFPPLDGRTTCSARVPAKLAEQVEGAAKLAGIGWDAVAEQALGLCIERNRQGAPTPGH